jgi:hypothetical protein
MTVSRENSMLLYQDIKEIAAPLKSVQGSGSPLQGVALAPR